jgi:hypothetical protein
VEPKFRLISLLFYRWNARKHAKAPAVGSYSKVDRILYRYLPREQRAKLRASACVTDVTDGP